MRELFYLKDINIDIDEYLPELTGKTIVVVHDFYNIKTKYPTVFWSEFKKLYMKYETDNIIFVGLNRMRNSNDRCLMVHTYTYKLLKYQYKAIFDTAPFNGEPWRSWYHSGLLYGNWLGCENSFPVESNYNHGLLQTIEYDEVYINNIIGKITKPKYTDLDILQTEFSFYEPSEQLYEYYIEAKKHIFETYNTPKMIISNLLKIMNKHLTLDINYNTYLQNKSIVLPELKIYEFLVKENLNRMNIYNQLIGKE